jgi:hypothetical protein
MSRENFNANTLSPLSQFYIDDALPSLAVQIERSSVAIDFALDQAGDRGLEFLALWRSGQWDSISLHFPKFSDCL